MNPRDTTNNQFVILQRRLNDYKKNSTGTSLVKDLSIFSKTYGPQYGGSTEGPHIKKSLKLNQAKIYYLAHHNLIEYFSCEVLLRIGINTPKIRVIITDFNAAKKQTTESKEYNKRFLTASKAIDNYIPITAARPDTAQSSLPQILSSFRKEYTFDMINQVIISSISGRVHKISGNLFAMDIAATLISDSDLQSKGNNLGLVKMGNRFYAFTLDKDKTSFKGSNYYQLLGCLDEDILEDKLFKFKTIEQTLAILYEMQQALITDKSGVCDFDRIFLNPRIKVTACLDKYSAKYCENIKYSVLSMLNYYKSEFGSDILDKYQQREILRYKLADAVIAKLDLSPTQSDTGQLKDIIMEDLRAPYYSALFLNGNISPGDVDNNPALLSAMTADICDEFTLTARDEHQQSMKVSAAL